MIEPLEGNTGREGPHIIKKKRIDPMIRPLRFMCVFILCAALLLMLCACGDPLRGTWTSSMSIRDTSITFSSSGEVELEQGDFVLSGSYAVSNNVIVLNVSDENDDMYQITMKYKIDGKKLYLVNENGKTEIFVK